MKRIGDPYKRVAQTHEEKYIYLNDFDKDMKRLAEDATIKKWWVETDPCQFLLKNRKEGERWASMQEIYHSF